MSNIGDSSVRQVSDKGFSPFKSRSTVIFLACLCALLYINCLSWFAGFFNTEFALVSVYLVRDIMIGVTTHQKTADAIGSTPTSNKPPNAS